MEEKGIGRPSTYASTIGTIQDRGYVFTKGQALVPTWLAFAVTRLLEEHFTELVDYEFTASMEEDLDRIANGELGRVEWLQRFYFGDEATTVEGLKELVDDLGEIDAREISTIPLGEGMVVRVGRYGPYVEEVAPHGGYDPVAPRTARTLATLFRRRGLRRAPSGHHHRRRRPRRDDPGKGARAARGRCRRRQGPRPRPRHRSRDHRQGGPLRSLRHRGHRGGRGRAGHERSRKKAAKPKPRTASLFKDMDLATIDLDTALKLLSLPRVVGADPEGVEITAQNGRYGPYLKRGTDSRSLQTEQQLFDITLEEALAIYAQPKQRGRAAAAAAQGARRGPGQRQARRRQGRPLRPLRHRRRDQRDPAQGRRPRVDHTRAWLRAARREARQGPHDPQAGREEVDPQGAREAGDQEGHHEEDLTFQRPRAQRHTASSVCR